MSAKPQHQLRHFYEFGVHTSLWGRFDPATRTWHADDSAPLVEALADLPLSAATRRRINEMAARFDGFRTWAVPPNAPDELKEAWDRFYADAIALLAAIRAELGSAYHIINEVWLE